jgi:hypothetical protein
LSEGVFFSFFKLIIIEVVPPVVMHQLHFGMDSNRDSHQHRRLYQLVVGRRKCTVSYIERRQHLKNGMKRENL